jgi:hypothetical protein
MTGAGSPADGVAAAAPSWEHRYDEWVGLAAAGALPRDLRTRPSLSITPLAAVSTVLLHKG